MEYDIGDQRCMNGMQFQQREWKFSKNVLCAIWRENKHIKNKRKDFSKIWMTIRIIFIVNQLTKNEENNIFITYSFVRG